MGTEKWDIMLHTTRKASKNRRTLATHRELDFNILLIVGRVY